MQRNYLDFDRNNYYAPVSWLVCTDDIAARAISAYACQVDSDVIDAQGRYHEGYVEVSNGQVIIVKLDGKTIYSPQVNPCRTLAPCCV
jgi:hypothetical protein